MKIYTTSIPGVTAVPAQSCTDVSQSVKGVVVGDEIAAVTPPGKLGNLSINVYASAADAVVFHFCNAGATVAKAPLGTYSFLAVH
jgi:hypothetical protein